MGLSQVRVNDYDREKKCMTAYQNSFNLICWLALPGSRYWKFLLWHNTLKNDDALYWKTETASRAKHFTFLLKEKSNKACVLKEHSVVVWKKNNEKFFFVYMWRTLPPFQRQTVRWDLIFLWEQLVYSVIGEINISEFALLHRWYCKYMYKKKIFSKTT